MDERGNIIEDPMMEEEEPQNQSQNQNTDTKVTGRNGKTYNSTSEYKPQGGLIYEQSMFDSLEKSVKFKL